MAVGGFVIDIVPPGVKDAVISLFGTGDKVVLLVSVGFGVALLAVAAGLLEFRRPPLGVLVLAVVAGLGALAAVTREVRPASPPRRASSGWSRARPSCAPQPRASAAGRRSPRAGRPTAARSSASSGSPGLRPSWSAWAPAW